MRRLVSKGKHIVTGVERFMTTFETYASTTNRGVMLDGEPNMERGDYIFASPAEIDKFVNYPVELTEEIKQKMERGDFIVTAKPNLDRELIDGPNE